MQIQLYWPWKFKIHIFSAKQANYIVGLCIEQQASLIRTFVLSFWLCVAQRDEGGFLFRVLIGLSSRPGGLPGVAIWIHETIACTWAAKKAQEKKLDVAEMRMLRRTCGVTKMVRIRKYRIRGMSKVGPTHIQY